jgi:hypothetical protein
MPALRLLLRATPFLLGAVAAAVWLRRDTVERPLLPPPREPIDIVTVVDDLLVAGR